jgi:hypothetical protein
VRQTPSAFLPFHSIYQHENPTNSSVFFVVFRESLEIVVVVSVLFAFLKQTLGNEPVVFRKLCKQVL